MKRITFEDFVKKYKPIANPFNPDAPHNGLMFETYGPEYEYMWQHGVRGGRVITVMDDNSLEFGVRLVNRVGYILLSEEYPPEQSGESFIFDGSITDTDEVISITEDELNRTANRIRLQSVLSDIRKENK